MTLSLTSANLQELVEQAKQRGETVEQQTLLGIQSNLPCMLGEGGDQIIPLRGGLTLNIRNAKLRQTMALEVQHGDSFPLVAKFYLSGASRVKTPRIAEIKPDYSELSGYNYLYHLPNLTEVEEWQANVPIQVVKICAPIDYFRLLSTKDEPLPSPLNALMQDSRRFHQCLGKMTPAIVQVLQQILHCPYQGCTQQLYLESKALELLTLQFACLESTLSPLRQSHLKADDLERVQYARDILVQNCCSPPSLLELARQARLNDRKLKQGFRQLFGTTVFGYLRDYRMQQAQQLLHSPHTSIAEVATQVGYRNPEAFSTAFRRKFAISPKAYQLAQHRIRS